MRALLVALLACSVSGCAGASATANVSVHASASADVTTAAPRVQLGDVVLAELTRPLAVACEANAVELCNAVDDDCDGRLDEDASCPYGPGDLHVVVAWNSDADLDLYLTEPTGTTVSFQSPTGAAGIEVQHAGRGACGDEGPATRVESARIVESATPGSYAVTLHYLMECDAHGGPTTAVVSVSVGGARAGTWTYTLTPNERVEVLRFELQ
jgi:uncharacterized protein YfaP (DUF2135 family)